MLFSFFALAICDPESVTLFQAGDYGSKYYRIPAIVRAQDGSLVTATDQRWTTESDLPNKIYVVVRRSTDNGKTWSEPITVAADDKKGYGDASLVVDKQTGTIMCIYNGLQGFWTSTASDPQRHFYSLSTDNGLTWTEPTEFTSQIYGSECSNDERKNWKAMFISSGASLQLRDGRIMAVGVVQKSSGASLANYPVWTDDLGKTWSVGGIACDAGDESKVVELNNGTILMSIRHSPNRYFALSHDRGETWESYRANDDVKDPACNGDLVRYTSVVDGYDKDRLIHTIPYSKSRSNVSILISYDEGATWPEKKVIQSGGSAYSSVAILNDGTIAVYYEKHVGSLWWQSFDLVVEFMSLDWVTDGRDTYTPPK